MRVLPDGVLGGDCAPEEPIFIEPTQGGDVEAARKLHVSLARGEQEIEWTLDAGAGALQAVSDRRRRPDAPNSESERRT